MIFHRCILLFFTLGLLSACAVTPDTDNREPPQVSELSKNQVQQQENNLGEARHLKLNAFFNQHGNVSLRIENQSTQTASNILVALRLRFTARIVSDSIYAMPESIKAGQSLEVDTEIPLPTARSIIRAEIIKADMTP